jgi:hypothetical protein
MVTRPDFSPFYYVPVRAQRSYTRSRPGRSFIWVNSSSTQLHSLNIIIL